MRNRIRISCTAILATCLLALPRVAAAEDEPQSSAVAEIKTAILRLIDSSAQSTGNVDFSSAVRPGESIYSLAIEFEKSSWADWWSKPDLFVVIECEGREPVLIPQIEYDWDYSRKILNVRCPTLPADSRCVLRLYDDDSASDAVWKNLLSSRVKWNLATTAQAPSLPIAGVEIVQARLAASGQLQLLDPALKDWVTLDAHDPIASAEFIVPPVAPDRVWTMEGPVLKGDRVVGRVSFKHQATSPQEYGTFESIGKRVMWYALIGVTLMVLLGISLLTSR